MLRGGDVDVPVLLRQQLFLQSTSPVGRSKE
jgi:hypothetical protein